MLKPEAGDRRSLLDPVDPPAPHNSPHLPHRLPLPRGGDAGNGRSRVKVASPTLTHPAVKVLVAAGNATERQGKASERSAPEKEDRINNKFNQGVICVRN